MQLISAPLRLYIIEPSDPNIIPDSSAFVIVNAKALILPYKYKQINTAKFDNPILIPGIAEKDGNKLSRKPSIKLKDKRIPQFEIFLIDIGIILSNQIIRFKFNDKSIR